MTTEEFKNKDQYNVKDLVWLTALLRSENGCPWDKVQTHASLRKNLIEEAYEVAEAIDRNDTAMMREELGDLLFQIAFHSQIEKENGHFDMDDAANDLCVKMIRRHPHIFGDDCYEPAEALSKWESLKREEKGQQTIFEDMDHVAKTLPSLMRAQKLLRKARNGGCLSSDSVTNCYLMQDKDAAVSAMLSDLISICDAASQLQIDLEELLGAKCEELIDQVKKEETNV